MDWLIWLAIGIALLVAEVVSTSFVMVYFAVGALGASLCAALGAPFWFQAVEFVAVSVVLLVLTRGLLLASAGQGPVHPTNVAALAGRRAVVTIAIDNDAATGQIRVGTEYWTARTLDDDADPIPVGARVEVVDVAGVTARVRPLAVLDAGPHA
jgi:membrane protein implicated in regulation of membrane protease activity